MIIVSCGISDIPIPDTAEPLTTLQLVYTHYGDTLFPGTTVLSGTDKDSTAGIEPYQASLYFGSGTDDIDMTKMEKYAILTAAPVTASQFGVIKAKSEIDAATVAVWMETRFIRVASDFSSYLPFEENVAKNAVIKTSGCYVWYVACADNESVLTALENTLQNQ
jgi:hypothetical protein